MNTIYIPYGEDHRDETCAFLGLTLDAWQTAYRNGQFMNETLCGITHQGINLADGRVLVRRDDKYGAGTRLFLFENREAYHQWDKERKSGERDPETGRYPEAPAKPTTAMELYEIPELKHNPLINLEEKRQDSDNQAGAFEYERDLEAMRRKQLTHLDIHFGVRVDDLKRLLKKAKKLQPKKKDRKGVGMWGDEMYDILFVAVTLEIRNGQLAAYVYVPQPETNEIVRQYVPERIQVSGAGYSVDIPVALDALVGTPSAPGNLDFEDKGSTLMMRHEYATGDLRYQSGKSRVRVARAVVRNRHWSRPTMTAELSWQCYDHDDYDGVR